ncbi:MAG: ABC transporter ATP-binding protein [Symbiobacteriaceae bacterium]|nr:ABC transporter ATP-binding protein [Symbiobacteriaceae bacterium]
MEPLAKLHLQNLSYSYGGAPVLEDVSFSVAQGQFVTLLGPSGCGKSTLLHIIAGLLPCPQAVILCEGQPAARHHFAYMPQDDLLLPWRTVLQNACLFADIQGRDKKEALQRAETLLEPFGLAGTGHLYPGQLSGGMRQRAAFLRTFLCQADILLLDEPFGALDALTRNRMQEWLITMREALGRTIILVTHDIEEAVLLSDRILILSGSPAGIVADLPVTTPVARRDRNWLLTQIEIKQRVYQMLT